LNTFALFFPEVPSLELSKQKIMVADIQRVAKLLGEKIKADGVRTFILHKTLDSLTVGPDARDVGDVFHISRQVDGS
jgi:hypothetical protein